MKNHAYELLDVSTALGIQLTGLGLALSPTASMVQDQVMCLSGPRFPSLQNRNGNRAYLSQLLPKVSIGQFLTSDSMLGIYELLLALLYHCHHVIPVSC